MHLVVIFFFLICLSLYCTVAMYPNQQQIVSRRRRRTFKPAPAKKARLCNAGHSYRLPVYRTIKTVNCSHPDPLKAYYIEEEMFLWKRLSKTNQLIINN